MWEWKAYDRIRKWGWARQLLACLRAKRDQAGGLNQIARSLCREWYGEWVVVCLRCGAVQTSGDGKMSRNVCARGGGWVRCAAPRVVQVQTAPEERCAERGGKRGSTA